MNVNGPQAAEGEEARERLQRKAEDEGGQIDDADGVNRIERMLAMRRESVEMLGAVMNGMKAPQKRHFVLQAMCPVDAEVAQHDHFDRLQPPRLRGD